MVSAFRGRPRALPAAVAGTGIARVPVAARPPMLRPKHPPHDVSQPHGPADRHDALRGRLGAFERALRTLRTLRSNGVRTAVVSCVYLITDVLYVAADPRIRLGKGASA